MLTYLRCHWGSAATKGDCRRLSPQDRVSTRTALYTQAVDGWEKSRSAGRPLLEPKLATPTSTSLVTGDFPTPPPVLCGLSPPSQKSLESGCRFLPLLGLKVEGSLVRRYEPSPPNPLPKATSESLCFLQYQMGVMKKRSRTNGLFAAHTASTLGDALITFPSGGLPSPH